MIAFTANGKRRFKLRNFHMIGVMSSEQLKTILMDRIGVNLPVFVYWFTVHPQIDVVQIHVCRLP